MAKNSVLGPCTLGPNTNFYYWFSFAQIPWGEDNRTLYVVPRPQVGQSVFVPEIWIYGEYSMTNTFPPYPSYNLLVENRNDSPITFSFYLQPFGSN